MDQEERTRRREERRRRRDEDSSVSQNERNVDEMRKRRDDRRRQQSDTAETNGPTEESGLTNDIGEDDSERLQQEEEEKKRKAAAEKERKRNAEIERQKQEDIQKQNGGDGAPGDKPKKKFSLFGKVSKGRKKEILAMMLKKARGDLQLEEQEAAAEKNKFIDDNIMGISIDSLKGSQLREMCAKIQEKLQIAEGEKFDLEIKVKRRDLQISSMKVKVNETRGRFAMPTLKSVSKSKDERKDLRTEPVADN